MSNQFRIIHGLSLVLYKPRGDFEGRFFAFDPHHLHARVQRLKNMGKGPVGGGLDFNLEKLTGFVPKLCRKKNSPAADIFAGSLANGSAGYRTDGNFSFGWQAFEISAFHGAAPLLLKPHYVVHYAETLTLEMRPVKLAAL